MYTEHAKGAGGAVPSTNISVPSADNQSKRVRTYSAPPPTKFSLFNRDPSERFRDEGQKYRAKLIGMDPVPRNKLIFLGNADCSIGNTIDQLLGEQICQEV